MKKTKDKFSPESTAFIQAKDICDHYGFSRTLLINLRKRDPLFPPPFTLGSNRTFWKKEDIIRYFDIKIQMSRESFLKI